MIEIHRHTSPADQSFRASLLIKPSSRFDLVDVRGKLSEEFGEDFARFPKAFFISNHTTAGFLDQRLAELLRNDGESVKDYLQVFQEIFPPDAGYVHDELHLRSELSAKQKKTEPKNADSHLTFIGAGLDNSAAYELHGSEPVWFVELDGVHIGGTRQRRTTVIAYGEEVEVACKRVHVGVSAHALDAYNLRDPDLGFIGELQGLAEEHRVAFGRFDVSLPKEEQDAGLTVNEYETLLVTHDLREVLRNPFKFMAMTGRDALRSPLSIPVKAINYARFDAVRVLNSLMDRMKVRRSVFETVINRAMAVPVAHFLRMKRSISLPVLDREGTGVGEIGWGTYQSPILMQWGASPGGRRSLDVRLVRFA